MDKSMQTVGAGRGFSARAVAYRVGHGVVLRREKGRIHAISRENCAQASRGAPQMMSSGGRRRQTSDVNTIDTRVGMSVGGWFQGGALAAVKGCRCACQFRSVVVWAQEV
jgi:hypothetical protein